MSAWEVRGGGLYVVQKSMPPCTRIVLLSPRGWVVLTRSTGSYIGLKYMDFLDSIFCTTPEARGLIHRSTNHIAIIMIPIFVVRTFGRKSGGSRCFVKVRNLLDYKNGAAVPVTVRQTWRLTPHFKATSKLSIQLISKLRTQTRSHFIPMNNVKKLIDFSY